MGKFTISMVIFYSYVKLPEGKAGNGKKSPFFIMGHPGIHSYSLISALIAAIFIGISHMLHV